MLFRSVNRPVAELQIADNDTDIIEHPADKPKVPAILAKGRNALLSGIVNQLDAPTCPNCGHTTVRNGACYKCNNCGDSLGCS